EHAGRLGPRVVGQADPAERAARGREGDGRSQPLFGRAEPGVELGRAEPGLVDVTMAADVIFDRIDPPRPPQARPPRAPPRPPPPRASRSPTPTGRPPPGPPAPSPASPTSRAPSPSSAGRPAARP